jgi:hypothetical protein
MGFHYWEFQFPPLQSLTRTYLESRIDMKEQDLIMLARQHAPEALRALAEMARQTADEAIKKQAISQLVSRGFLASHQPTDADLQRIEEMTDEEILEVMMRGLQ